MICKKSVAKKKRLDSVLSYFMKGIMNCFRIIGLIVENGLRNINGLHVNLCNDGKREGEGNTVKREYVRASDFLFTFARKVRDSASCKSNCVY